MRSMKRAIRPVIAVTVVLLGSVAANLANAGSAAAASGTVFEVDIKGWLTGAISQPPYVAEPCGAVAHPWTRLDSNGWGMVQYTRSCGEATLGIGYVGQRQANGDLKVSYGATFRHNGSTSSRYKEFTIKYNTARSIQTWRVGSGKSQVEVDSYIWYG
jgi:hypothetical protein